MEPLNFVSAILESTISGLLHSTFLMLVLHTSSSPKLDILRILFELMFSLNKLLFSFISAKKRNTGHSPCKMRVRLNSCSIKRTLMSTNMEKKSRVLDGNRLSIVFHQGAGCLMLGISQLLNRKKLSCVQTMLNERLSCQKSEHQIQLDYLRREIGL